jgi:CRISPR system Cascade subunit CasD
MMKSTLLLRLQGPMQAWGVDSLLTERGTTREPTKSGVIGLLCAALGRQRDEPVDDLARLRMGVRLDREGHLMVDFHTAQKVLNAVGKVLPNAVISNRYYLSDALFLVGLEGENLSLLEQLQEAVRNPKWLLFLGRKAFPTSSPVWLEDGIRPDTTLENALESYPWLATLRRGEKPPISLRCVIESNADSSLTRQDVPLSFRQRNFGQRRMKATYINPFAPKNEE